MKLLKAMGIALMVIGVIALVIAIALGVFAWAIYAHTTGGIAIPLFWLSVAFVGLTSLIYDYHTTTGG